MTTVLDASAIVALLADEPGGTEVEELLGARGGSCSAVNLAEVLDWLIRLGRVDPSAAREALAAVVTAGLEVVPCDKSIGLQAGELRALRYDRRTAAISLADCVAVATAFALGATLVTSDGVLCRVAQRAGVDVHPIANSAGRRPRR